MDMSSLMQPFETICAFWLTMTDATGGVHLYIKGGLHHYVAGWGLSVSICIC